MLREACIASRKIFRKSFDGAVLFLIQSYIFPIYEFTAK